MTEVEMKTCTKCGLSKPATTEYFNKDRRTLHTMCRNCNREYMRAYYQANKEKLLEDNRRYRVENAELVRERARRYAERRPEVGYAAKRRYSLKNAEREKERLRQFRIDHADKIREQKRKRAVEFADKISKQRRAYRLNNVEKLREQKRMYRQENAGKVNEGIARWHSRHPEKRTQYMRSYRERYRYKHIVKAQKERAKRRALPHEYTAQDWLCALEYFNNHCAICGRQLNGMFHTAAMDHWIPVSSPDCAGTVRSNIIPLCHGVDGCNNSKGNREPFEWLTRKFGKRFAKRKLIEIEAFFRYMETI